MKQSLEETIRSVRSAKALLAQSLIERQIASGSFVHEDYLRACDAVERFANSLRLHAIGFVCGSRSGQADHLQRTDRPSRGASVRYSMVFVLASGDLLDIDYPPHDPVAAPPAIVLLRKPSNHKNPLFRGRWTVPGGLIEDGETDTEGAARELLEEAALWVHASDLRPVLTFSCNCDPTEPEHEVAVMGVILPAAQLLRAKGTQEEPVIAVRNLPENLLWYIDPLLSLVKARMRQPR